MTQKEKIALYYKCMGEKLKAPLYDILHQDLMFFSQYAKYTSRDSMIEDVWPEVGKTRAKDLEIYGEDDHYMVKYRITHSQKNWRNSEYIEFKDGKIFKIEVFVGFEITE